MRGLVLAGLISLFTATAVGQIHNSCHTDNHDSRTFAVAYAGAIIDLKRDDTANYQMPPINYAEAFDEVCKVVDQHPELWDRPSREAVTFAVDQLWRKKCVGRDHADKTMPGDGQ